MPVRTHRVLYSGVAIAALMACMALSGCRRRDTAPSAAALQVVLNQPPVVLAPPPAMPIVVPDENVAAGVPHDAAIWADVQEFYKRREGLPVWISDRSPAKRASAALDVLRTAPLHGLVTTNYGEPDIVARLAALDAGDKNAIDRLDRLAELEVRLTTALFSLGRDVAIGRTSPQRVSRTWKPQRTAPDFVGSLALAAEANLTFWLDGLRPQHPEYPALQKALADLRARTPATPTLAADVQRIELNLERWRWMPDDFGTRALIVNIPLYRVQIRENEQTTREIRVVVGKRGHETPIFSGVMSTIVFSPYWNIPDSIVAGETAPAVAKDPRYLAKHHIEILRTTSDGVKPISPSQVNWDDPQELRQLAFRQKPGPDNALGHVKFLFPNEYDVYLHDSPADELFARPGRAFSHGCVRVEEPETLAQYVMRDDPDWPLPKILAAMNAGIEKHVKLKQPLPVHIVYFTAMVDAGGGLTVLPDVYGYDAKQAGTVPSIEKKNLTRRD